MPLPPDGPSYFTAALAAALDPEHDARTLGEVIAAARQTLAGRPAHQAQTIKVRMEPAASESIHDREICNAPPPDRWTPAALASPLGEAVAGFSATPALKEAVGRIGRACWAQHRAAVAALPDDPWRDPDHAPRVLKVLADLLDRLKPPLRLDVAEVAALSAAVLVRDGVRSAGMARLVRAGALSLDPVPGAEPAAQASLDEVRQRLPQLVRQARRLHDHQQPHDRDAVLAWLAHQAVTRDPDLRQVRQDTSALPTDLLAALAAPPGAPLLVAQARDPDRLIRLALAPPDDPASLAENVPLDDDRRTVEFRERLLGDLLDLAGAMALDARDLPIVVVEHIGLATVPLLPADLVAVVARASWRGHAGGLALIVNCPHPALDQALRDLVARAEAVRARVSARYANDATLRSLADVPSPLVAAITASSFAGRPAYSVPHLRFELAHDEVRELLMGESLYGDPSLAIRELYQNALDACRYREARSRFLGRDYVGRIRFEQGVDEKGRPYIECRDNGIG